MTSVDDDLDIRAALADLTEDQPPVPAGRLAAVRGKAVASRRRRISGAALAVAAVAALAVSLATLPRAASQQPLARQVPGWALPWPDHRNGSVPQSDLGDAVLTWRLTEAGIVNTGLRASAAEIAAYLAPYQVTWYLAQTIDHGRFVVVMFEARRLGKTQLVFGYAPASQLAGLRWPPGPFVGRGPWVLAITRAPDPDAQYAAVSGVVNSGTSSHPDDWIVMLAAPGTRSISWRAMTTRGLRSAATPASSGLAVTFAGGLTGQVLLTGLSTARGFVPLEIAALQPGERTGTLLPVPPPGPYHPASPGQYGRNTRLPDY